MNHCSTCSSEWNSDQSLRHSKWCSRRTSLTSPPSESNLMASLYSHKLRAYSSPLSSVDVDRGGWIVCMASPVIRSGCGDFVVVFSSERLTSAHGDQYGIRRPIPLFW